MPFTLGERSLTINVKNKSLKNPENTVFTVKDYKGTDVYKGTYFIPDIKKLDNEKIDLSFNSLHCQYNIGFTVNPNNFQKNIDIVYTHKKNLKCGIDIKPESMKENMTVQVKETSSPIQEISLNDLSVRHYFSVFIFGLFLVIAILIKYMDKKGLLLNNRD